MYFRHFFTRLLPLSGGIFLAMLWLIICLIPDDRRNPDPRLLAMIIRQQRRIQNVHNAIENFLPVPPDESNRYHATTEYRVMELRGTSNATQSTTTPFPKSKKIDVALAGAIDSIITRNPDDKLHTFISNSNANKTSLLMRQVPDTRHNECRHLVYPEAFEMPMVSVVIAFFNEVLHLLLRTVDSIMERTPSGLLREIILVDDHSTLTYLKNDIDLYFSRRPKVRILRNQQSQGLTRAWMTGARNATGDVLIFVSSYTECNVDWLEPLLAVLVEEPEVMLQPETDSISATTLEYSSYKGKRLKGGFGWDLRYAWFPVPPQVASTRPVDPYQTPVLSGHVVAVWRNHFIRIGGFDEGLQTCGGEHLDLSFRNWLCGGQIYTVPCSRVGHLHKRASSIYFQDDREHELATLNRNLMRIAEIWLGDYKDIFYRVKRATTKLQTLTNDDIKSIKQKKELNRQLKCRPFKWILDNVLPEQILPRHDTVFFGEIKNMKTNLCLAVDDNLVVMTDGCRMSRILPQNTFAIHSNTMEFTYKDMCVFIDDKRFYLHLDNCSNQVRVLNGIWSFVTNDQYPRMGRLQFYIDNVITLCITSPSYIHAASKRKTLPTAIPCSQAEDKWLFTYRLTDK